MLQITCKMRHKTTELKVMVSIKLSILLILLLLITIIIITNFVIIDMSYDILHVSCLDTLF